MNQCIVTLGLMTTLSLVSCTQVSNTVSSKAVTPDHPTASGETPRSQPINSLSPSADVRTQSQKSAVSSSGELAQLWSQESGSRIDVRSEPSEQSNSLYSGQVGDKGRVFDMTRDNSGQMWHKVRLDSGIEGWVKGQFVQLTDNINSLERPFVVMGQTWIQAQPSNDAPNIGQLQGGEVVKAQKIVRDQYKNPWFYIGKGWVGHEFLYRPACISFNGNPLMVVGVGGADVLGEPSLKAPVTARLDGGAAVPPLRKLTNDDGTWFEMEKGWVNGKALFYPTCQDQK